MIPFRFLISLALLSLVAAPAHATVIADAAVRTSLSGDILGVVCSDHEQADRRPVDANAECTQAHNHGHGRARASLGSLEAYARLYSFHATDFNHNYQAYGWARFSDELGLGSGLLEAGEWTDARIVFEISGSVDKVDEPDWMEIGDMFIPWTFRVTIDGLEVQPSNQPVGLGEEWYFDFDIANGDKVRVSAELIVDVRCFGCDVTYEGIADFMGTASVSEVLVRDPDSGEFFDPADFTITSLEGGSYANVVPIPEPGTAFLLACGLVALAARRRRH